ncbi:MAG: hypothetical protein U0271_40150 [Polyangiaceae bacterium]
MIPLGLALLAGAGCGGQTHDSTTVEVSAATTGSSSGAARAEAASCPEVLSLVMPAAAVSGPSSKGLYLIEPLRELPRVELREDELQRDISEARARELGAGPNSGWIWVLPEEPQGKSPGKPGCRLEPRSRALVQGPEPWQKFPILVTVLAGECELDAGRLAARTGNAPAADIDRWRQCSVAHASSKPEGTLALDERAPASLRDGFAPSNCAAPDCELRTAFSAFAARERRLEWSVATRIFPRPGTNECDWIHQDFTGLLAEDRGSGLVMLESWGLDDVLLAAGDIVGFTDRGIDEIELWRWPLGSPPVSTGKVRFGWAHEEDFEQQSLSAYCGP